MLYDAEIESYQQTQNSCYFVPRLKRGSFLRGRKICFYAGFSR